MEFTKDKTQIVKGVAVTLLLINHLFGYQEAFSGYGISFFPLSEERVVYGSHHNGNIFNAAIISML